MVVKMKSPCLSDKSLGSSRTHEQHSSAQCVPVAMQLLHSHCSEQTGDHHIDIGFHLLKGYIHSLLRCSVQEIFNTADIWRKSESIQIRCQGDNMSHEDKETGKQGTSDDTCILKKKKSHTAVAAKLNAVNNSQTIRTEVAIHVSGVTA